MRERMHASLDRAKQAEFDLKQGSGGIADIEFMVQFAVLRGAHDHPALCQYTDNIRLLAGLAEQGLLSAEDAAQLSDAYRAYRAEVHHLALQDQAAVVSAESFRPERGIVQRVWRNFFEQSL